MVFKPGQSPHNKGKTKENYEPLAKMSRSRIGQLNAMYGRDSWNKGKGFEDFIGKRFTKLTVIEDVGHIIGHRHFRCLCDCGKSVIVNGSKLKNMHTQSCGCITTKGISQLTHRKKNGEASLNALISSYKQNALTKHIFFDLSKEDMITLFAGKCFYCGCEPSTISYRKGFNGEFIYNGIDRLDNGIGYVKENIVSCCKECNFKKGSQGHTFFLQWVKRIYEHKFK